MAEWHYCWRCKGKMPLLDRDEWELLEPLLRKSIANVQAYRERHNAPLSEAVTLGYGADALAKYQELTGYKETNVNALWHHRLDNFGPPCAACGRLLRTARARFCAECGASA